MRYEEYINTREEYIKKIRATNKSNQINFTEYEEEA